MRRLFERVASLKLSSKKMKYVFKRWLGWEQAHGDAQTVAHVKARAREYVESKAGGGGGGDDARAGANRADEADDGDSSGDGSEGEEEEDEEGDESD